jgi:hypothetical protein
MLSVSASYPSHFVDHANYNPKESGVDGGLTSLHRPQGFMDYTDDSCMHEALDKTDLRPPLCILYNGHAGLGANLVGRSATQAPPPLPYDPVGARHFDSRRNEVSIESSAARKGNEIVTNNQDPDVAVRADEAIWACLPEVDDEVLVAFEHGDTRRPYLVGALWNSGDKPPETAR